MYFRCMRLLERGLWLARLAVLLAVSGLPQIAFSDDQSAHAIDTVAGDNIESLVQSLNDGNYANRSRAVEQIAKSGDPAAITILTEILSGNLYQRRDDKFIVRAEKVEGGYALADVITGESLGKVGRRGVRKVSLNNKLRGKLRELIAGIRMYSPDAGVRLAAVTEMLSSMDASAGELFRRALPQETDVQVRAQMQAGLAFLDLESTDLNTRLDAIEQLKNNVTTANRTRLRSLAQDEDLDVQTRTNATAALESIELTLDNYRLIEKIFFGLSLGSVLVLAAIGLAITFGVMGIINMAHGELIMLGAYTAYVVQQLMPEHIGLSIIVAIPLAFVVSGLVGIAIERGVIRFLYGRPLETLLATFGISLILQQAVRSIFSPLNRSVETPGWMSGSLEIVQGLSLTYNRLYILLFSLMVFAVLLGVLHRTRLGLEVRAVAQNRNMARAMGVRSNWVDALTFGLGSGIAGVAGVALSQLTNVGPNLGQGYIVDSFMVVVFGGVGNIWGTLVAGLSLGIANKFLEPWAGAVMAKIVVLVFIILFIQKRPSGLFPQKGRAVEN